MARLCFLAVVRPLNALADHFFLFRLFIKDLKDLTAANFYKEYAWLNL